MRPLPEPSRFGGGSRVRGSWDEQRDGIYLELARVPVLHDPELSYRVVNPESGPEVLSDSNANRIVLERPFAGVSITLRRPPRDNEVTSAAGRALEGVIQANPNQPHRLGKSERHSRVTTLEVDRLRRFIPARILGGARHDRDRHLTKDRGCRSRSRSNGRIRARCKASRYDVGSSPPKMGVG